MITLEKTLPGSALHMGVLLRDALKRQGVRARVVKPYASLPYEHLVVEMPGRASVWISCLDVNGRFPTYDIARSLLMAVSATVTDEKNTRHVYYGEDDTDRRPVAQAEACARAVAAHFKITAPAPVLEARAAELEARQALRDMWRHGSPRCPITRYAETAGTIADALNDRV